MRKLSLLLGIVLLVLLSACYLENPTETNFPAWTVRLEMPLMKQSLGFSDILDDSLITTVEDVSNSDSVFAFRKTVEIDTTVVGNQLIIDNVNQSFSQSVDAITVESTPKKAHAEIGQVSLPDIGPLSTEEFSFSDLMPAGIVSALETAISMSGGSTTASIPGTDVEPVTKSFSFDDFESATFASGTIAVTITNNMVIPLGKPITISLVNSSNTVIESINFSDYVATGTSETQTLDLTGKTLSDIDSIRVSGHSDGSQGGNVTITTADLSKGFSVNVNITNMVVSSATAKIPAQTISNSDSVALAESDTKITEATIATGSLDIDVTNAIELNSDVTLTIQSLVDGLGNPLEQTISLSPNLDHNESIDLSNYTIQMDTSSQQLVYSYAIETAATDPASATIEETDSIDVTIALNSLTFSSVSGYISQDAIVNSDVIALGTNHTIQEAVLDSGILAIQIQNNMGIQADVSLAITELKDPYGNSFSEIVSLPPPSDPVSTVEFNLQDYSIELTPENQNLHYESSVVMDESSEMTINFDETLDLDIQLSDVKLASITGIIDPVTVDIASIEQEITALPEELDGVTIQDVELTLDFLTNIDVPVYLDLSIYAYNDAGESDSVVVSDWNITEESTMTILDAEDLINLRPNRIVAGGSATIGDGVQSSTIHDDDFATGNLTLLAPLSFEISEDLSQEMAPELVDADMPEDIERIQKTTLYTDIDNEFLFGAFVEVVAARDSNSFHGTTLEIPDTLALFTINPGTTEGSVAYTDSVVLDSSQIRLFQEPVYIKMNVHLLGQSDGSASRIRTSDSLFVTMYSSVEYLNDHLVEDETEEQTQ